MVAQVVGSSSGHSQMGSHDSTKKKPKSNHNRWSMI